MGLDNGHADQDITFSEYPGTVYLLQNLAVGYFHLDELLGIEIDKFRHAGSFDCFLLSGYLEAQHSTAQARRLPDKDFLGPRFVA